MKIFASLLAALMCGLAAIVSPSSATNTFDYVESIVVDHTKPPYKHALLVRLNRRVTEAELRSFAQVQREKYPASEYDKLFISYLLVGQPEGSGLWASSHWQPDLQITIVGQSAEQAGSTKQRGSINPGEELVGAWSSIGSEIIVVLKRKNKTYFRKQSDGSVYGEHEVKRKGRNYFITSEGTSYSLFEIRRDGILVWKLPDGTISYEFAPF